MEIISSSNTEKLGGIWQITGGIVADNSTVTTAA